MISLSVNVLYFVSNDIDDEKCIVTVNSTLIDYAKHRSESDNVDLPEIVLIIAHADLYLDIIMDITI